jgi:hypothetical protein
LTGSRLTIGRFSARYLVAADHPDPGAMASRLDDAAAAVGQHLAARLGSLSASSPDAIWLLRRVEVELGLDAGSEPDAIAAAWSAAIARAVAGRLDTDAQGVVFFTDPTAYLTAFLRDLAAGEAWSLWYYRQFDGLRALPIAAALRTAILADTGLGRAALLQLAPMDCASVLNALTPLEAQRVLEGLTEPGPDATASTTAIIAAWRGEWGFGLVPERLALAFFLSLVRQEPGANGQAASAISVAMAVLRGYVVASARNVLGAIQQADMAVLYRAAGSHHGEALAALLPLPAATRLALTGTRDDAPDAAMAAPRYTPYGGPFLLLPHLLALTDDAGEDWPEDAPLPSQLLRLLVLGACMGEAAIIPIFLDPLWRDLFGIPGRFLLADLALGTSKVTKDVVHALVGRPAGPEVVVPGLAPPVASACVAAADQVLAAFARRLPGFAGSSPEYLRRNFLSCTATAVFAPDAIRATLSRPPLHLVLSLAGMTRARFDLPWLGHTVDVEQES